jgi:hypothetical protein
MKALTSNNVLYVCIKVSTRHFTLHDTLCTIPKEPFIGDAEPLMAFPEE